jgi:hypothetical protein
MRSLMDESNDDPMASNIPMAVGLWFAVIGVGLLICVRWAG